MDKDFDDFESEIIDGMYSDANKEVFYRLSEKFDVESEDARKAFAFAQLYTEELTLLRLRQYHEWASR